MARQQQVEDFDVGSAPLLVFALGLIAFYPPIREALYGFGTLIVILLTMWIIPSLWAIAGRLWLELKLIATSHSRRRRAAQSNGFQLPFSTSLVDSLPQIDWFQFEQLIYAVFTRQEYTVFHCERHNSHGSIDLLLEKAGELTGVHCQHWRRWRVGERQIREFSNALASEGLSKGIFVTLAAPTPEARKLARQHGIRLIDKWGVINMLAASKALSDPEFQLVLSDERKFCPKCENELVKKPTRRDKSAHVWSCENSPHCRFTLSTPCTA